MGCIGDISEVKTLYQLFELKLARLRLIACRGSSADEYEVLKIDLKSLYDRIIEMAGKPYF